jgi:hypothetical protein
MKSKMEAHERPLLHSVECGRTKQRGIPRGHPYKLIARGTFPAARIRDRRMLTAASIYRVARIDHDDPAEGA